MNGRLDRTRRFIISGLAAVSFGALAGTAKGNAALKFGLTPVFLSNDLELLSRLKNYLSRQTGREVQLVQRRTYEEITALLLSGQLTAAWICGYPLVQYREELSLVAVPLWEKQPLYSSYLIVPAGRRQRASMISGAISMLSPTRTATPAIL